MSTTVTDSSATVARSVIQRMLEGFATGDTTVVDQLCAPDLMEHQFGMAATGAEALAHVKAAIRDLHATIPDLSITVEDAVETDDTIWVRARARGTATGPFFGPPSGRPVDATIIDIARVADGRIAEHWGVPDRFAVLAQTGVLARLADTRVPNETSSRPNT